MFKAIFLSASFLWRIPIKGFIADKSSFEKALSFFPLIGALEGLMLYLLAKALSPLLYADILSLLLLVILFFLRGIFHLDGLSDTFDALSYKGGLGEEEDRKRRLEIMKDSTVGVSGVVAIVINILSKYLFFKTLIELKFLNDLFLPFLFSRTFLLGIIYFSKPARKEGLGFLMKESMSGKTLLRGYLLTLAILFFYLYFENFKILKNLLLMAGFNFVVLLFFKRKFEKAFGGLTGDNFGALVELSEIASLFYLGVIWPKL